MRPLHILIVVVLVLMCFADTRPRFAATAAAARKWNVISGFDNRAEAAALLARVHHKMVEFMRFLKRKYHIDETDDMIATEGSQHARAVGSPGDTYNIVDHLLDNYDPDAFYENDPRHTTETSYTLNKGASMHLCLRRKDDPTRLVDENDLLFVMLHESAHIANYRGWGHGRDFWTTFKFILHEAKLAGVYVPVDYSKYPTNYCGLDVAYNPYFDQTLPNIWE